MDISNLDDDKSLMQNVKQRFFAMRNGVVADALRKAGSPFRIIFGLNVPQLREIASVFGHNRYLAEQLWLNDSTRESRLLAPMLIDPTEFTEDDAHRWIGALAGSAEEIDMLCHSLLRKIVAADALVERYGKADSRLHQYLAQRLDAGLKCLRGDNAVS